MLAGLSSTSFQLHLQSRLDTWVFGRILGLVGSSQKAFGTFMTNTHIPFL